jgi:hypothetical protein
VATTNKDFVVKAGLKVATGVTFPDNTTQTTAFTGNALTVGSTFPVSPSNGNLFLYTVTERIYFYYDGEWNPMATYFDAQREYDGNGITYPTLFAKLDGGTPSTSFGNALPSADGGSPSEQF